MRATIDLDTSALITPSSADQVGTAPAPTGCTAEGGGLHLGSALGHDPGTEGGRVGIPPSGTRIGDDELRALLDAGRR